MEDDEILTPRSGRTKKKSTLSRLAAKKKSSGFDENNVSTSRESISGQTRLQGTSMEDDLDNKEMLPRGQFRYDQLKGEKRYRDQNSDGDDLKVDNGLTVYNGKKKSGISPGLDSDSSNDMDTDDQSNQTEIRTSELENTKVSWNEKNNYRDVLHNISSSDIDLRKHSLNDPLSYSQPKRTVSLSQADIEKSTHESDDSVGNLKSFGLPKMSTLSPTPGHRTIAQSAGFESLERPWSGIPLGRRTTDLLSERSYASTSAVPHITTQEAKTRSYLLGSAVNGGSLLGAEELERFFPDRQMRIFMGTWNMCEMKIIPQSLDEFIHPESLTDVCDMYVIGTQESCSNRREWEIRLQESIGPHHVLLHSAVFGVLYLLVFIRKDLIWYCSVTEESNCGTRAFSQFKTKGGIAISVTLFGTSFLFVNSHLAPHDGKGKQRIEDYQKISRTIDLPKIVKCSQTDYTDPSDITTRFDCVFWCGDMNWRILKEEDRVKNKLGGIQSEMVADYEALLEHDELTQVRNHELAFKKFQEGRIKFPPTYKYDIGTDKFDTSPKLRIPSYTDRILFHTKKKGVATCLKYDSASNVKESDHRPVYGMYEVNLRPGRDNIPLSAGQFNRDVWVTAMKRRAMRLDILQQVKDEKSSKMCNVQ